MLIAPRGHGGRRMGRCGGDDGADDARIESAVDRVVATIWAAQPSCCAGKRRPVREQGSRLVGLRPAIDLAFSLTLTGPRASGKAAHRRIKARFRFYSRDGTRGFLCKRDRGRWRRCRIPRSPLRYFKRFSPADSQPGRSRKRRSIPSSTVCRPSSKRSIEERVRRLAGRAASSGNSTTSLGAIAASMSSGFTVPMVRNE